MFIPREPYPDGTRGAAVHRDTFVTEGADPSADSAPLHDPYTRALSQSYLS